MFVVRCAIASPHFAAAVLAGLVGLAACAGSRGVGPERAAYVRDASRIAPDGAARATLLAAVRRHGITDVIPYGMAALLDSPGHRAALAEWIDELHRRGARVIAPIAGRDRVAALANLVREHPTTWLDGMVTELEFWNRADRGPALEDMLSLVAELRAHAGRLGRAGRPARVGAYLGYPTRDEARRLSAVVDFVFLDYSVPRSALAWRHVRAGSGPLRDRFGWFSRAGVAVWPIFYATGEVDLAPELRTTGLVAAEAQFRRDLAADAELGGQRVAGFVYFTLDALPAP